MTRRIGLFGALVGIGVAIAASIDACSSDKSFALVSVITSEGEISGVAQLRVDLRNGGEADRLFFPHSPTADLTLTKNTPVTFSVSFKTSRRGLLEIGVTPLSVGLQPVAYGAAAQFIDPGHISRVTVVVVPDAVPPITLEPRDGGAGVGGVGGTGGAGDAGTGDGATPSGAFTCEPTNPTTCGAGRTCFLACRGDTPTGLCTMGGTTPAGGSCMENKDCEPGSQCFEFPCMEVTTKPRMCMRFCQKDEDCGGDRKCTTNVPCGRAPTMHKVCSHTCDPTGTATMGCPAGLFCFIFQGELPDCDCRGKTRTAADGESCEDTKNCQPGLLCVSAGPAGRTCRPLCRLDTGTCPAGRACAKLTDPDYKTFGACLPQ